MAEVITADMALGKVRSNLAAIERAVALAKRDIGLTLIARGKAAINGGVLRATAPNVQLSRYFGTAMRRTWKEDGVTLSAGLPPEEEQARTLAHRETGGRIDPKRDRPHPHLRVPLDAALTGAGKDRYEGVKLRDLIGKGNPFVLIPTPHAPKANAILVKRDDAVAKRDRTYFRGKGVEQTSRTVKAGQRRAHYALVPFVVTRKTEWWTKTCETVTGDVPAIVKRRLSEAKP